MCKPSGTLGRSGSPKSFLPWFDWPDKLSIQNKKISCQAYGLTMSFTSKNRIDINLASYTKIKKFVKNHGLFQASKSMSTTWILYEVDRKTRVETMRTNNFLFLCMVIDGQWRTISSVTQSLILYGGFVNLSNHGNLCQLTNRCR